MATQAQLFVPTAVEKMRSIKRQLIALQSDAAALKGEFTSLGGNAMTGYGDAELWANYPFTAAEFTAAMNDLTTAHNAIALSTIYSVGGYNTATKIAIG
jgi:hypothetical protein